MVCNAFKERIYVNVIDGTEYEMLWAVDTDKKTLASGSGLLQLTYLNSFFQVSTNHHYFLSLLP